MEKIENNIAYRLRSLISALGLSDSQFADKCEISRATLSLLLSGKNKKISDVLLSQIHEAFPEVSIIWLLFSEGEMFIRENNDGYTESYDYQPEIEKSMESGKEDMKFQNLIGLNTLEETIKRTVIKAFETILEDSGFSKEKNSDKLNKKKVRQITVYYDDSTFETFTPEP